MTEKPVAVVSGAEFPIDGGMSRKMIHF